MPTSSAPGDGSVKETVTRERILGANGTASGAIPVICPLHPEVNNPKNPLSAVELDFYIGVDKNGGYVGRMPLETTRQSILDTYGPGNYYTQPVNFSGDPVGNGVTHRLLGDPRAVQGPAGKLTGDKSIDTVTLLQMQLSEERAQKSRESEARKRAEDMHQAVMLRMMEGPKGDNGMGAMATVLAAAMQSSSQTMVAVLTSLAGKNGMSPEIQMMMQKNDGVMNTLLASVLNPNKQPTTADRLMEQLAGKALTGTESFDAQLSNYQKFAAIAGDGGNVKTIAALSGVAKDLGLKDLILASATKARMNPPAEKRTTVTVESQANGNGHADGLQPQARQLQTVSNPPSGEAVSQDQAVAELDMLLRDQTKTAEQVAECFIKHVNDTKAIPGWIIGPLIESKDNPAQLESWWTRLGVPQWSTAQYAEKVRAALGCINMGR